MNGFFDYIITFFDGIATVIGSIIQLGIEGANLIVVVVDFLAMSKLYFTWLPLGVAGIVTIIIDIAVLYRILGWGD